MKAYRYNGQQIAAPGAYADVPIDTYHSGRLCVGRSVSTTSLKRALRSPAHFWARSAWNPNREPEERSDALDEGAAAHCQALEPEKFAAGFVVSSYDDFRGKEARLWRESMRASGKTVLTEDQHVRIGRMADRLRRHRDALSLFRDGLAELTFAAQDEQTGLWMLTRPDFLPASAGRGPVDYKTTRNAEPEAWSRQAFDLGYHVQAALALDVIKAVTGEERSTFWMVVQEKDTPFAVSVVRWEPEQISVGQMMVRNALNRLADCLQRHDAGAPEDEAWPRLHPRTGLRDHPALPRPRVG